MCIQRFSGGGVRDEEGKRKFYVYYAYISPPQTTRLMRQKFKLRFKKKKSKMNMHANLKKKNSDW